jgi:hypothetical protein
LLLTAALPSRISPIIPRRYTPLLAIANPKLYLA